MIQMKNTTIYDAGDDCRRYQEVVAEPIPSWDTCDTWMKSTQLMVLKTWSMAKLEYHLSCSSSIFIFQQWRHY
jgi:hypothetical protein